MPRGVHMSREQKEMARRLAAQGVPLKAIARDLNFFLEAVSISLRTRHQRHAQVVEWVPPCGRLRDSEREAILVGLARGFSMSEIARQLGRAPSTVTREVAKNGGPEHYGAWSARRRAEACSKRPKVAKLSHPPLVAQVSAWLTELWSPQEIAQRLRIVFADDPMMQVSHETIYQSLFVQGRGELRRELARCLRSGRAAAPTPRQRQERGSHPRHGQRSRNAPLKSPTGRSPGTGRAT